MTVEALKSLGTQIATKINMPKAEKAAEASIIEGGERMLANGQDAAAMHGRTMLKTYKKPEIEVFNIKEEDTIAASGGGNWGDHGGGADDGWDDIPDVNETRRTSIWDD